MKKTALLFLTALCFLQPDAYAGGPKTVTLTYDIDDFSLSYDGNGALCIGTSRHIVDYGPDLSAPGLPLIPVSVLIPDGCAYRDFSVVQDKTLYSENVIVAPVPVPVPTSALASASADADWPMPEYDRTLYPQASVGYVGTSDFGGCRVVSFLLSPFEYDAGSRRLYFTDSFTLEIQLTQGTAGASAPRRADGSMRDVVRSIIVNAEDLEDYSPASPSADAGARTDANAEDNNYTEQIDYIVITSSGLKESFEPLTEWKRTKGVRARIITMEDIKSNYEGNTVQLKIKKCIWDLYTNNGLKYVLLGGDDTVVPVQGCYGRVNETDPTIPTDLFYACFSGDFNWDADGDGIYGEIKDNVDLTPSVFITRVPVRTHAHICGFVDKILCYEKTPTVNGWNNDILMAGNRLWDDADAEAKGEILFSNYISPYWNGGRKRFYDTATDFSGGAAYDVTAVNLQNQLSQGYAFVDMITHGSQTGWGTETGDPYSSSYGISLKGIGSTIITTMACSTNAFDSSENIGTQDPCLSESLIRNANSGVVAYLGCSRSGWGIKGKKYIGSSLQYEAQFYNALFTSTITDKNFGVIVAAAKLAMARQCKFDGDDRWVQFGLNPIGDPEMPVFIEMPQPFTNVTVIKNPNSITVNTDVPGCRICVMDSSGGDYYSVLKDVQNAVFLNTPSNVSICVTKQGYIPKVITTRDDVVYIQNETVIGPKKIDADIVRIGSHVTDSKPSGTAVIGIGEVFIDADNIIIEDGTVISSKANLIINNKQ